MIDKIHQRGLKIALSIVCLINVIGLVGYYCYYQSNGYLPAPFIYDKSNTFMDFYNSIYWAFDDERYTEWNSIYPPIVFLFLKIYSYVFQIIDINNPEIIRQIYSKEILGFLGLYFLIPLWALGQGYWMRYHISIVFLLYIFIVTSTPMLFALERGNLIILSLVFLSVMFSKEGWGRVISIAILVNIKPYFVLLSLFYLITKNYAGFLNFLVVSGLIFLFSGLILDHNFYYFFFNLFGFSQHESLFSLREIMSLPSSVSVFSYFLKNPDGYKFATQIMPAYLCDVAVYCVDLFKWLVIAGAFLVLFIKSELLEDQKIFALLLIIITNLGIWVGGYSFIFYLMLIPVIMEMKYRWIYFSLLALIIMPIDYLVLFKDNIGFQYSFLSDQYVSVNWEVGIGGLVRPIVNIMLLLIYSFEIARYELR